MKFSFFIFYFRVCIGSSVHATRQRNITYLQTVRHLIYNNRLPEHPDSPICWYIRHPQGLAVHLPYMESCPTRPKYVYVYRYIYSPKASRSYRTVSHPLSYLTAETGPTTSIASFVLLTGFDLISLVVFDRIRFSFTDPIRLKVFDEI